MLGFSTLKLPASAGSINARVDYAVDHSGGSAVKHIYHIKDVSTVAMEAFGKVLFENICMEVLFQHLPAGIRVNFSESPTYRSQHDLLIWRVPLLRSTEIQNLILRRLLATVTALGT